MPSVQPVRTTRLTPRPTLGLLYLVGTVLSALLLAATLVDGRIDPPATVALLCLLVGSQLLYQRGIYLVGDRLLLRNPLSRTVVPLDRLRAVYIRPLPARPGSRLLHLELHDGTVLRTHVGVTRSPLSPAVKVSFEQLVGLVGTIDSHRRQATGADAAAS
ncbi:hypothetical protein Cs7R123_37200 [Catellatospora sp. TT07R-123]|uniref:hypothetical protein n=1 Tax=Catellatospora sp. TT07R-123 TaxID=2733863 RepID=UPI001B1CD293|nr:hypothetical protein [Catellatospora sp. TT07R-123]GHJ46378.1 hypothetical protein Cs7R123_37200 [Catellatospora sp. TT07R-123]